MQSNEKMQILIVDDVEINREIFAELLEDQYLPLQAGNGLEAVELIHQYSDKIALILLDIMMPELDGYGVLQEMQAMNLIGTIPVIIISALEGQEAIDRAYELGATDFLSRNADSTTLNKRIFNYIQLFGRQKASLHEISTHAELLATQKQRLETLDELTGCNNLASFRKEAEAILAANPHQSYALWYCDIKQFKLINSRFGYDVGDYVIKYWAKRIELGLREGETYGRLSGDRFVVLTHYDGTDFLASRFWKVVRVIESCLTRVELDFPIELAAGVYLIHPDNPENLSINLMLDRANLAQQSIKGSSGSHFCLYDQKMLETQLRRSEISKHLSEALQNGEIMAYFQPQFDFSLRAVAGVETLCRWKHGSLGWLSPAEFIPVLERSNQIFQLDAFIWREACRALADLRSKGILTPLSVNVSRADIQEEALVKTLTELIGEFGLKPEDLHLEVTESAYIEDSDQLKQVIHTLRDLGFCIEMDDFGSGYSSLNTLRELPVDMMKLDATFIRQAVTDPRGRAILTTVIDLSRRLHLPLIAEGIETLEQAQNLLEMGCRLMQGYYFARPMPMADFLAMMDTVPNVGAHHSEDEQEPDNSGETLQESNELLRQIMDLNSCGIFAYTMPDRRVLVSNREAYRLMGVEEREIRPGINPYHYLAEQMHPADRAVIAKASEKMLGPGNQLTAVYRLMKGGKMQVKVSMICKYLQMPSGEELILSTLVDVTEKSRMEEQLSASLQAYHIASQETGDAVFIYNTETKNVYVESAEMCLFSPDTLVQNVPQSIADGGTVAPESREEYLELYQKILDGAESASAVIHRVRITGEPMVAQMRLKALTDGSGNLTGQVVGVITDITTEFEQGKTIQNISAAQRKIQQVIKAHEEVIRALSADYYMIYLADLEHNTIETVRANDPLLPRLAKVVGRVAPLDRMVDTYLDRFLLPEDRETIRRELTLDNIRQRLRTEGGFVLRFRRVSQGRAEYMELKAVNASENQDGSRGVLAVRNIDAIVRRELESQEQLRTALAQAESASQAKSRFLTNMSHDIRTPMNAIMGFSAIAAGHPEDSEQVRHCLEKIQSASGQLQMLLNDILNMSKIEGGPLVLRDEKTRLSDMLLSLIAVIQAQAKAKGLCLRSEVRGSVRENVYVDSTKLSQVLLNILSNAVKFTPQGGSIRLTVFQSPSRKPDRAVFTFAIRDTGIGMSQEFVSHIYDLFERENTSTLSRTEGSGLGMAIVKRIVDAMEGQIRVESTPGVGTTVTVSLELRLADNHDEWEKALPLVGRRVCLVGPEGPQRENLAAKLTALSVDVVDPGAGAEAAILFSEDPQDLETLLPQAQAAAPALLLCAPEPPEGIPQKIGTFCREPIFLSRLRDGLLTALSLGSSQQETEEPGSFPRNARILLVEDNPLNQEIAWDILKELGLRVDTASNGQEAVRMAEQSPLGYYKLILMDIQMPVMNGYEAAKAIRALNRPDLNTIPIVALTADAFREDAERAIQCGMNDHLTKPIDVELLVSKLHTWLQA